MGKFGSILGGLAGAIGSKLFPIAGVDGATLGSAIGGSSLIPFKTGGKVPGRRGRAMPILAHSGEIVLPLNARATRGQLRIIASNKRKAKKRK